jgi:hypothetical protein
MDYGMVAEDIGDVKPAGHTTAMPAQGSKYFPDAITVEIRFYTRYYT